MSFGGTTKSTELQISAQKGEAEHTLHVLPHDQSEPRTKQKLVAVFNSSQPTPLDTFFPERQRDQSQLTPKVPRTDVDLSAV